MGEIAGVPVVEAPGPRSKAARVNAQQRWRSRRTRVSAGLAVFARDGDAVVVALVRPRTTYAFRNFVFGAQGVSPAALARGVTPAEAAVLLLRDYYAALAYLCAESRAAAQARSGSLVVQRAAARFAAAMAQPEVMAALGSPQPRAMPFSVPKGRLQRGEQSLSAALREWQEETGARLYEPYVSRGERVGLASSAVAPLGNLRLQPCRKTDEFPSDPGLGPSDHRVDYHCAVMDSPVPVGVETARQLCEIAEVRWVPVAELAGLVEPRQLKVLRGFREWLRNRRLV